MLSQTESEVFLMYFLFKQEACMGFMEGPVFFKYSVGFRLHNLQLQRHRLLLHFVRGRTNNSSIMCRPFCYVG